jgi:hypothetical protein
MTLKGRMVAWGWGDFRFLREVVFKKVLKEF